MQLFAGGNDHLLGKPFLRRPGVTMHDFSACQPGGPCRLCCHPMVSEILLKLHWITDEKDDRHSRSYYFFKMGEDRLDLIAPLQDDQNLW
jgi:hypothetical protein